MFNVFKPKPKLKDGEISRLIAVMAENLDDLKVVEAKTFAEGEYQREKHVKFKFKGETYTLVYIRDWGPKKSGMPELNLRSKHFKSVTSGVYSGSGDMNLHIVSKALLHDNRKTDVLLNEYRDTVAKSKEREARKLQAKKAREKDQREALLSKLIGKDEKG